MSALSSSLPIGGEKPSDPEAYITGTELFAKLGASCGTKYLRTNL